MPCSVADRVIFDLDDTLYLERNFAFSGFNAVADHIAEKHNIMGFSGTCQMLFNKTDRTKILDEALHHHGLTDIQPVSELIDIYRNHEPQITLCPDAAHYLSSHGGPFGLITDGPERTQHSKIKALGLEPFCNPIIPTGQWPPGFGKPHPRAYQIIADIAAGQRCVYVADNARKDFVTPNQMGWLTIQILRPGRVHTGWPPDADHAAQIQITTLDQLDDVLS